MQDDVTDQQTAVRVLVLEDEFLIAMEIGQMLARLGCVVVGPVPTVARALVLLDGGAVDFAILDVNLGDERSTPVADALRARGVPFALSTGYDSRKMPEAAFRGVPHLGKPLEFQLLRKALRGLSDPARQE